MNDIKWGISALNHGSSISVFKNNKLLFWKDYNEEYLNADILYDAFYYGEPKIVYWYENPWLKKARQIYAGQYNRAFDFSVMPRKYMDNLGLHSSKLKYTSHHASHAAAGYYTSKFDNCAIVVADAIGEFQTVTIWKASNNKFKKIWQLNYPESLGLFYSAFTKLIGLQPILEEGILEQMSVKGDPYQYQDIVQSYFNKNLHKGITNWPFHTITEQDKLNIAASVQTIFSYEVEKIMKHAKYITGENNLVYMGGCAMNKTANKQMSWLWEDIWSLPNAGDATSSIGSVLYHTKERIEFNI